MNLTVPSPEAMVGEVFVAHGRRGACYVLTGTCRCTQEPSHTWARQQALASVALVGSQGGGLRGTGLPEGV